MPDISSDVSTMMFPPLPPPPPFGKVIVDTLQKYCLPGNEALEALVKELHCVVRLVQVPGVILFPTIVH